jgi:ABC-type sulfate/molybdate transport systems ATPase subunit
VIDPLIELRDVVIDRGERRILDVPHLILRDGAVLAALGRNGAGKSTLLRAIGGLVNGEPSTADERRRLISAVLQRPLLRRGTVSSNVESGMRFRGVERRERAARAEMWLSRLGLSHLSDLDVHGLSGGEAQRVSLARAVALRPRLMLLDEPFTSLDSPTKLELLADFRAVIETERCAVFFVTHDRHEASLLADRVAILDGGRILQEGRTADVYDQPSDTTSAELVGYRNQLPADQLPSSIPRKGSTMLIRAADLTVGNGSKEGWAIPAVAVRPTIEGDAPSVLALAGTIPLTARLVDVPAPAPGDNVTLLADPTRVRWC